jgi:flagellar biosynthetic protein FlhB
VSDSNKTEQPTTRRIQKAREKGHFPTAKMMLGAVQFLAFLAILFGGFEAYTTGLMDIMPRFLNGAAGQELSASELLALVQHLLWVAFAPLAAAGAVMLAVIVFFQFAVTQFGVSFKPAAPDLSRLSPLGRLRDLPRQNILGALQALVLIPVFLYAMYAIYTDNFNAFLRLPLTSLPVAMSELGGSLKGLLWKAGMIFAVFGAVEFVRERRHYLKRLRMSKQEVRDEMKESEGNPQMRMRIRRLMRDLGRRQMISSIPKATVVIVNPTHYAVAIRYETDRMNAPVVVAKARNYLALRIRELAASSGIPVVENPPLARALYQVAEVGQEIPPQMYRAVAEVLAWIHTFTQKHRRP